MEMPSFPTVHLKVEYPHGAHKRWQVREDVSFGELLQAILDKYPGRRPPMMGPLGLLYEVLIFFHLPGRAPLLVVFFG